MKKYLILGLMVCFSISACQKDSVEEILDDETTIDLGEEVDEEGEIEIETPDWSDATHSKDAELDYSIVFPDNEVIRLDLTISTTNWSAMQSDLDDNMSSGGGPGGGADIDFTPIWVPCTLSFEGLDWYQVGIRYKGNSTLKNAYSSNTDKYPFKLDFDEFEGIYPAIKNQRFYGFKQLNLSSNYDDASFMRELVAADLFRSFGVRSSEVAFCAVYLDRGDGAEFVGLYTLIEEMDDTVYETQFDNADGNLYKPDGNAATFASGTYDEGEMDLKTNEAEGDYSDVKALYDLMQDGARTSDNSAWQASLESIFDIDQYLKYLAVNTVIQNWDTYGVMTHNYFLYNNEGKLTWIPWDNNESMQDGKQGGAVSLSMSEVSSSWPLIRYVMDVESYEAQYQEYVRQFTEEIFTPSQMSAVFTAHQTVIAETAALEGGSLSSAVSTLNTHVEDRNTEVEEYLR
ncbi:MAG: CotH kinase family protein [Reichenbachiella sp.]